MPATCRYVISYYRWPGGGEHPTPVDRIVGVVESLHHVTRAPFTEDGDAIMLLGEPTEEIGATEYLYRIHGVVAGPPPRCDLDGERRLADALLVAIRGGHVRSAHDCSDGGLAVALAECVMSLRDQQVGADVDLSPWSHLPLRALLFGEAQGRVVVSTPRPAEVLGAARAHGVPARAIGYVRATSPSLAIAVGRRRIVASVSRLARAYHEAIPGLMSQAASAAATTAAGLESPVS